MSEPDHWKDADNAVIRSQEAMMGRPRELTNDERAELLRRGLRPFEVWLPDVSSEEFWKQMEKEGEAIRASDRRQKMDKVLDAFAEELWDDLE